MPTLPESVQAELLRQQTDEYDWPNLVPAFAEVLDRDGRALYIKFHRTTLAHCEQIVEHESRLARYILEKGYWRKSKQRVQDVVRHILTARIFRCREIQLLGTENTTEDDMPFPNMTY